MVSHKFLFGARKRREYLSDLCVALCGTFRVNILCNAAIIAIAISSEPRTEQVSALAIAVVMLKLLLPFIALVITGIVHLLAWSKIEKISTEV